LFVLDTNVVSEFSKEAPDPCVVDWMAAQSPIELHISAVTLGELVRGITRLPIGRKQDRLRNWLVTYVGTLFDGRILPFDETAARRWGHLVAVMERSGRPRPPIDLQIAATALVRDAVLVARNVQDFDDLGITLINPWKPG